jgi:hypothetical protein
MPAYDHPIRISVPAQLGRPEADSVAAVIKFTAGPDQMARIQRWLDRAAAAGIIEQTFARKYHSAETSAELYFP